eukprot:15457474-Alexandrium_andersonii.AAC.1
MAVAMLRDSTRSDSRHSDVLFSGRLRIRANSGTGCTRRGRFGAGQFELRALEASMHVSRGGLQM